MVSDDTKSDPLLVEREKTHGSFIMGSKVAQELKEAFRWGPKELQHSQREALDLIATKIGRIVCGDPNNKDHWEDIAGYAKLGAEVCKPKLTAAQAAYCADD